MAKIVFSALPSLLTLGIGICYPFLRAQINQEIAVTFDARLPVVTAAVEIAFYLFLLVDGLYTVRLTPDRSVSFVWGG